MVYAGLNLAQWGIDSHTLRPGDASRRLLFTYAHPDDESFGNAGSIAAYTQQGVAVHYVCGTRGECGGVAPDLLRGYASIGALREAELNAAAHALNLASYHFLNYRDSGMAGSPENTHPQALVVAPLGEVTAKIVATIRALRPQVVVTFNPYGGYGHPDHIAMHHATLAAFDQAAASTCYPEQIEAGLAPWKASKLYYSTFNTGFLRLWIKLMPLFGVDPRRVGENKDMDFVRVIEESTPVTARIASGHVGERIIEAWMAHRSQIGGMKLLLTLPKFIQRRYTNHDSFTRVYPESTLPEDDLFAGI